MYDHCDAICQAVAESGIKANISRGMTMFLGDEFDFEKFPACQELVALRDKWQGYDNGRSKLSLRPRRVYLDLSAVGRAGRVCHQRKARHAGAPLRDEARA